MTCLEKLEEYAYSKCIDVHSCHYNNKIKGCCMVANENSVIFLNKNNIRNSQEEICVLAEEVGHIETDTVMSCEDYINPSYKRWLKQKNEILAKRWAVAELLPFYRLKAALLTGKSEVWQLADFFELSEDFIKNAIDLYTRQGNLPLCD